MRVFRHAESICGLNFFGLALLLSRIWPHLVTTHAHYFFACFLHKAKCFCKTRQSDFAEYTPCNTCTMHKCRGCYTHNLIFSHYSLEKYMCLSWYTCVDTSRMLMDQNIIPLLSKSQHKFCSWQIIFLSYYDMLPCSVEFSNQDIYLWTYAYMLWYS